MYLMDLVPEDPDLGYNALRQNLITVSSTDSRSIKSMAVWDFLKGELLEIIEWTDDSRDTLSYRFPDQDMAIKNGAQLIVRESQVVQFVWI